ncbi:MAG: BTAD domain-containing putative transcriptional regulator [Mycobacteriales bacterium]
MGVRFQLLGPVEARWEGRPLALGPPRQRSVLAALLVEVHRPVPLSLLVDRVWGQAPPATAAELVYVYVSRLRRALAGPVAGEVRLVRVRSGGYQLDADPQSVDLHRFQRYVAEARAAAGDDDRVAALLRHALDQWEGRPLADLTGDWFAGLRTAWEDQRVTAAVDHHAAQLRRGRHADSVAELGRLAAANPLDERVAALLMLALYRAGRQAEALAVFLTTRAALVEELGVDPGTRLRRLHEQILTTDPALLSPAGGDDGPAVATPPVPPRQLPTPPAHFIGRSRELALLDEALGRPAAAGGPAAVVVVDGVGGIGKTWLALRWAHRNLDLFPDGQLYLDLHGFDPSCAPLAPATAVRTALAALGIRPDLTPKDLDAQAALYRSLVAGRRLLVVLDDARDTEQVLPLLPGGAPGAALVTSRVRLPGLSITHGARAVPVEPWNGGEAVHLLAAHLGERRLAAEPAAVADLVGYCAGLPLAVGILAVRAEAQPELALADLAGELRDAAAPLDAFDTGELSSDLRTVFDSSYRALPEPSARLYRLLGLAPGPDLDAHAAAALADLPVDQARRHLRELDRAHLVTQRIPGRYGLHDLVRLHAREQARVEDPEPATRNALRGLVAFYVRTAHAAARLVDPHRRPLALDEPDGGADPAFTDDAQAMAWFTAEHPGLLAAQRLAVRYGWNTLVWRLAWALTSAHYRQGRVDDEVTAWQAGLAAVADDPDGAVQSLAHRSLGRAYEWVGWHDVGLHHLRRALTLARRAGDAYGRADAHRGLAAARGRKGDRRQALAHARQALALFQTLDNPVWEADALNQIGWNQAQLGQHQQAREACERALARYRRHHDLAGQADVLDSLGYIAHHTGRYLEAITTYQQALALYQALGNTYGEADTLTRLGDTHHALNDTTQADVAYHQALALYRTQHRTTEAHHLTTRLLTK